MFICNYVFPFQKSLYLIFDIPKFKLFTTSFFLRQDAILFDGMLYKYCAAFIEGNNWTKRWKTHIWIRGKRKYSNSKYKGMSSLNVCLYVWIRFGLLYKKSDSAFSGIYQISYLSNSLSFHCLMEIRWRYRLLHWSFEDIKTNIINLNCHSKWSSQMKRMSAKRRRV